jgi:hypothetical protein
MTRLRELWLQLRWLATRSRFHSELADEIAFHMESRAEELEREGLPRVEALTRARREFGSPLRTTEDIANAWQMRWLEDLFSDVRYAARAFRRDPGFVLTATFCLALGIGANLTVFNIITSLLFSEPSCRDSSSMIAVWEGGNSDSPSPTISFFEKLTSLMAWRVSMSSVR